MDNPRRLAARLLRRTADRIDPTSGPRAAGHVFNYDTQDGMLSRGGLVITPNASITAPGCRLWYMAEDYYRAFGPLPPKSKPEPVRLNMMEPAIRC